MDSVPCLEMEKASFEGDGMPVFKLFAVTELAKSGGAARKLIQQGGAYLNGERLESDSRMVTLADFDEEEIVLRAGKKRYHRVKLG